MNTSTTKTDSFKEVYPNKWLLLLFTWHLRTSEVTSGVFYVQLSLKDSKCEVKLYKNYTFPIQSKKELVT